MERNIPLKTSEDVAGIRRSCRLAMEVVRLVGRAVAPGVATSELDALAADLIRARGAEPALDARFPGSVCLSVNAVAAHGVPSSYRLLEGDTIIVDAALRLEGWCGDAAWTFAAGEVDQPTAALLETARLATLAGAAAARAGARMGDIGAAIERTAGERGCRVLAEFIGHGIGRQLHEEPAVPHTGAAGEGLRVVPGMVFTIEPVLSLGSGRVRQDGWSFITSDLARTAQCEHAVAVFRDYAETLALPPDELY